MRRHFYTLFTLLLILLLVACNRSFKKQTAKYAEVGPVVYNRAAVLDINEGIGRWGYVDGTGLLVIECRYSDAHDFDAGLAAVQEYNELWGFIDTTGRMVIEPHLSMIEPFTNGLAWVRDENKLLGQIDTLGNFVIPCLYAEIDIDDGQGWMRAKRDGKWGALLPSGEVVVPCVYDTVGIPNRYGLIPVTGDGKKGFLGGDGREVLPCFYSYISDYNDGYARVAYGGQYLPSEDTAVADQEPRGAKWGLIDSLGRETIPCRYYFLDAPSERLAAFRLEQFGNYGYVDVKGIVAIPPRFAVARPYSGGVAIVSFNNVNFGLIDRNGGEISSFRYKYIGKFGDGLAPFNLDPFGTVFSGMEPRSGYLDVEGREVIPAKWDDASYFSEMRAAVMRYGLNPDNFNEARWGYIATSGMLVVPFKYQAAYPFNCGLARVYSEGLGYGYIDRQGNEVVPCKYEKAEDFVDFRAKVQQYGREMTIDDSGQIVNPDGQSVVKPTSETSNKFTK